MRCNAHILAQAIIKAVEQKSEERTISLLASTKIERESLGGRLTENLKVYFFLPEISAIM
jgi:hypothetical protein